MRLRCDPTWVRSGPALLAGSPLRRFRLTPGGVRVVVAIESGVDVDRSALVDRLLDAGAVHPDPGRGGNGADHRFAADDVTVVTPQLGGIAAADGRITVDDGSRPPVAGATIRLPTNRGPAAARNAARSLVDTALIAFVDADVDLLDEIGGAGSWLAPLLGHFDDPRVGLVAPRVLGEPGSPIDLGPLPARIRAGSRVSYVPGAAVVVRADALDAVGGFDERLRSGEDVDLVWRLDQAGWWCRFEPAGLVWHEPRRTLRARLAQHAAYGSSAPALALRHPGAVAPFRSSASTGAAWILAAAGHPLVALGLAGTELAALLARLPDVPAATILRLALRNHVQLARQLAAAARRVWWPILLVAAVRSRRARRIALLAVLADVAATPTDVAYGWGVWRAAWRLRTIDPLLPRRVVWQRRRGLVTSRPAGAPSARPARPPLRSGR